MGETQDMRNIDQAHKILRLIVLAIVIGLSVFAAARAATPPAQIAVSPSKFELKIGARSTTQSVTLMNLGDQPVDIDVAVANWDLDEANQVQLLEPDEQSLDQWMVINPLRFTVPGGGSQTVRFSIRPRVEPEPGEHRAMIYFNQVLPDASEHVVRVKFSVGVAVYGLVGEIERRGTLHDVDVVGGTNPPVARLDVSSDGSAHVRMAGQYAIYPASDYPGTEHTGWSPDVRPNEIEVPELAVSAGALPARPVLATTRREILLQSRGELPPGNYVLDLNGDLQGSAIDLAIPFTIAEPTLVAGSDTE
jgi:hypothetical protein